MRTTQRKRVFVAFRMLADTEDTARVSILSAIASAQATGLDGSHHRQSAADTAHSAPPRHLPFAIVTRIVHPHNALGVGELETMLVIRSHLDSRPARVAWLSQRQSVQQSSQPAPGCGQFCAQRPQLLLEQHGLQARQVILRRFLRSVLKKNSASARRGRRLSRYQR